MSRQFEYWNNPEVISMYDKHLLNLEINLIKQNIKPGSAILDAGCGDCETTLEYSKIKDVHILGVDFSTIRLKKAFKRLYKVVDNIVLKPVDLLEDKEFTQDKFDYIVSQRFLINILDCEDQEKILNKFYNLLKPGGKLLMLEGSMLGHKRLNIIRKSFGLPEIEIRNHNLFFEDEKLKNFMQFPLGKKWILDSIYSLGNYFLLTRVVRPFFEKDLNWNCSFNQIAATMVNLNDKFGNLHFSRLKLWVWQKANTK